MAMNVMLLYAATSRMAQLFRIPESSGWRHGNAEPTLLQLGPSPDPAFTTVPDLVLAVVFVAAVLIVLTWILVVTGTLDPFAGKAGQLASSTKSPSKDTRSLFELTESVGQVESLLGSAKTNLENFRLDLEDHEAHVWKDKEDFRQSYYRLAISLFLLLDHLDKLVQDGKKSSEMDWIGRRAKRILEDEDIEEIPVKLGDRFNGTYHTHVGQRANTLPRGTVVELGRKGYYKRGQTGKEDTVLRSAEVVVSSGPPQQQAREPNSRGTTE